MEANTRSYKCALYARISCGHAADRLEDVVESQTMRISEALSLRAKSGQSTDTWEISETYVDFDSGKNTPRPALQKLKQDITSGRVNFVAVDRFESLARSVGDLFRIIELFQRHDVGLYSMRDQIDTLTAVGRLQLHATLWFSRLDSETRAARSVAARKNINKELKNDQ